MDSAKAIAAERLARGEISADEYDSIIKKIDSNASENLPTQPRHAHEYLSSANNTPSLSKADAAWWILIPLGLFVGLIQLRPSDTHTLDPIGWIFVISLFLAFIFGIIKAAFGK